MSSIKTLQKIKKVDELDAEVKKTSESLTKLDTQFKDLIINAGNSNAEVAAARNGYITVGDRLDAFDLQMKQKANQITVNNLESGKMDKNTMDISVMQINKNRGKIDQTYLTDELLQQIAGNAPINAIPTDYSLTYKKFAFPVIEANASTNLFDYNDRFDGYFVDYITGRQIVNVNYSATNFIRVIPSTDYIKNTNDQIAFYDNKSIYISGITTAPTSNKFTTPANCYFIRTSASKSVISTLQINQGTRLLEFESFGAKMKLESLPYELYKNILVVSKQGGYSTINKAIKALEGKDNVNNRYTILISPGIYEESVDIRGRYISLVGAIKEDCIIKNYLNDYQKPPLNMSGSYNNAYNLTFISDKNESTPVRLGSYAIHIDNVGLGEGTSVVRNCTAISNSNAGIGLGTTNKQEIILENCTIISNEKYALYAHNYQLSGALEQKLKVRNCTIYNKAMNAVVVIQDSNHREGGANDDAKDTVFSFVNNCIYSEKAGIGNDIVSVDTLLESGRLSGYIKLGIESFGNNVSKLNKI